MDEIDEDGDEKMREKKEDSFAGNEELLLKGREVNARVVRIAQEFGVFVELGAFGKGLVHITNCGDDGELLSDMDLTSKFKVGEVIRCRVIDYPSSKGERKGERNTSLIDVSIRHLRFPGAKEVTLDDLKEGMALNSLVQLVDRRLGVITWLSRHLKALIPLQNIFGKLRSPALKNQAYSKALKLFQSGKVIKSSQIMAIHPSIKRIELDPIAKLHLSGKAHGKANNLDSSLHYRLQEINVGDFVTVLFTRVMPKTGDLLVYLPKSDFKNGFIPKSQISEHLKIDRFVRGDKLQVWIYKIQQNLEGKRGKNFRVEFTMRRKSIKLNKTFSAAKKALKELESEKEKRIYENMVKKYEGISEVSNSFEPLQNIDGVLNENGEIAALDLSGDDDDGDEFRDVTERERAIKGLFFSLFFFLFPSQTSRFFEQTSKTGQGIT